MSDVRTERRPSEIATLARGLTVQGNVIGALLMRELHTRFGRDNIGYLWMFGEPLTLALAIALLHSHVNVNYGPGINPVAMTSLGYVMFMIFRGMLGRAEGTLESNMQLLYHRSVTIFDMLLSRAVLESLACTVSLAVMLGGCIALGLTTLPARPLQLLWGIFLITWFTWALSMVVCAGTYERPTVGRLVHPIVYISMPLSCSFWPVGTLPKSAADTVVWWPLAGIFEQLRYGQFEAASTDYLDNEYVVGFTLLLTYTGLVMIRAVRRKVHLH